MRSDSMAVGRCRQAARLTVITALVGGMLAVVGLSPAEATFPGRNGRIAFSLGEALPQGFPSPSQIYTITPDGGQRLQLTHLPADKTAATPAWSPDGRRIAYVSNVGGTFQLWVMNADGSGQTRLLSDPGFADYQPSWSPDGRRLVFSRCYAALGASTRHYPPAVVGDLRRLLPRLGQLAPRPQQLN